MSNPDRDAIVKELLDSAFAEIEASHYPEGISPAAKNLAIARMALVPTPLLASGRQNVVNLVLWACAETELEIAGLIEPEIEDRFDTITDRPNQHTSGKCDKLLIGDLFVNEQQVYAQIANLRNGRAQVEFAKNSQVEELDMPADLLLKMLAERGYKRMT